MPAIKVTKQDIERFRRISPFDRRDTPDHEVFGFLLDEHEELKQLKSKQRIRKSKASNGKGDGVAVGNPASP